MTEQFLFKMDQNLSSKNKMDEEITGLLWSKDGTLITSAGDLEKFKNDLQDKVKEIHSRHPRCKEIPLRIWKVKYLQNKDFSVACGSCTGKIYAVKHIFGS